MFMSLRKQIQRPRLPHCSSQAKFETQPQLDCCVPLSYGSIPCSVSSKYNKQPLHGSCTPVVHTWCLSVFHCKRKFGRQVNFLQKASNDVICYLIGKFNSVCCKQFWTRGEVSSVLCPIASKTEKVFLILSFFWSSRHNLRQTYKTDGVPWLNIVLVDNMLRPVIHAFIPIQHIEHAKLLPCKLSAHKARLEGQNVLLQATHSTPIRNDCSNIYRVRVWDTMLKYFLLKKMHIQVILINSKTI